MTQTTKIARADAARNREKLVVAARELMAAEGSKVPLDRIAERAGVGVGTLYRHFPNREALLEAAYRTHADDLEQIAAQLSATEKPVPAMRKLIAAYLATAGQKVGIKEAIMASIGPEAEVFVQGRRRGREGIESILAPGQRSGDFRTDVTAADLQRLIGGMCMTCTLSSPAPCPCGCGAAPCNGALLNVVVDGLRR